MDVASTPSMLVRSLTSPSSFFSNFRAEVSWEFLVDLERLPVPVRLVDRLDLDRDWLTSDQGLNISTDSIRSFDDPDRYSWRLYDDSTDQTKLVNYKNRLNIDDLNAEDYARYDLLEFGSMFGSSRWILSKATSRAMLQSITLSLTFQMPVLDVVADEIEESLGGRANYIGLHLRVGDGGFKVRWSPDCWSKTDQDTARRRQGHAERLPSALLSRPGSGRQNDRTTRCRSLRPADATLAFNGSVASLDLSRRARTVIASCEARAADIASAYGKEAGDHRQDHLSRSAAHRSRSICPQHKGTHAVLAFTRQIEPCAQVYIATDAHSPLDEPSLAPFRHALPCLSFLSDFRDLVPELPALDPLRSEQEGVKMAPFLLPMLEAMIAGRGRVVLGTKGSTFSRYVVSVLHESYWREETNG